MKLFLLRRLLGLAYVLDGLCIFSGLTGAKWSLRCAIKVARARAIPCGVAPSSNDQQEKRDVR